MNFIKYFYAFRHSFTKTLTLILKRKNHTPQKSFKKNLKLIFITKDLPKLGRFFYYLMSALFTISGIVIIINISTAVAEFLRLVHTFSHLR